MAVQNSKNKDVIHTETNDSISDFVDNTKIEKGLGRKKIHRAEEINDLIPTSKSGRSVQPNSLPSSQDLRSSFVEMEQISQDTKDLTSSIVFTASEVLF